MRSVFVRLLLLASLTTAILPPLSAQFTTEGLSPGAFEQFRLGTQAYFRGRFAESAFLLEKALAFSPDSTLLQYWLGRAYFKNGFNETALRSWSGILNSATPPPFLSAKAESLRASRAIGKRTMDYSFVELARYQGGKEGQPAFSRPSALLRSSDGSFIVVAHGSNELLRVDTSGLATMRQRGGLPGFDRPFAAVSLPDGTLFVTEFNGDRISKIAPDGSRSLIGSHGRGAGQFIGPEYIASDDAGYLYVVDYGNNRVCKLDPDGRFLLAIGEPQVGQSFDGFSSLSGLLVRNKEIFIADSVRRTIFRFDISGNYLGELGHNMLHSPEGICLWNNGDSILVADTDRIVSIDLSSEAITEIYRPADPKTRITSVIPDANGNLIYCDFDNSSIVIIAEGSTLASGYDVDIERVLPDAFPEVQIVVQVKDRLGRPIQGLSVGNFYISESVARRTQVDDKGKAVVRVEESVLPASSPALLGVFGKEEHPKTVMVFESSNAMQANIDRLRTAIASVIVEIGGDTDNPVQAIRADAIPSLVLVKDASEGLRTAISAPAGKGRFDLAVRLAATSIMAASGGQVPHGNEAIVYIGTGEVADSSFSSATLSELAALLRNSGIRFFAVILDAPAPALRFLAESTNGHIWGISSPEGVSDLHLKLADYPSGQYLLSFRSQADPAFGRSYLSLGVEAHLYKRSGKDELGYFAPLK